MRRLPVVLVLVALSRGVSGQAPTIELVTPDTETVVTGPTVFAARVRPPAAGVREVVFFVDGVRACAAPAPRFRCEWDAGSRVTSRHVRAVARRPDGSQLSAALRTKDVAYSFHASVAAVAVSVSVKDSRGRFVTGLTASDFTIHEDGRRQEIANFSTQDAPADVALVLDISSSMAPVLADVKASARRFVGAVRPQDSLTVAAFNTGLFVVARPDATPEARLAQIERMRAFGRTSLFDSLVRAADLFRSARGRRALVVFTDGDDVASRGSADTARLALQSKDIVLYIAGQGRAAEDRDLRNQLRTLAAETGGTALFATRMAALDEQLAEILRDVGQQYLLTYSPDRPMGDGSWRKIAVDVGNRRHVVRARQGYFAQRETEP